MGISTFVDGMKDLFFNQLPTTFVSDVKNIFLTFIAIFSGFFSSVFTFLNSFVTMFKDFFNLISVFFTVIGSLSQ